MNRTVAVIVTYNRKEMLKQCVDSLLMQTAPCDVLVVNNASTDGTGEYLRELKKKKKIHVLELSRNL